jgi:hypothetical protein
MNQAIKKERELLCLSLVISFLHDKSNILKSENLFYELTTDQNNIFETTVKTLLQNCLDNKKLINDRPFIKKLIKDKFSDEVFKEFLQTDKLTLEYLNDHKNITSPSFFNVDILQEVKIEKKKENKNKISNDDKFFTQIVCNFFIGCFLGALILIPLYYFMKRNKAKNTNNPKNRNKKN